jgi:N-acetyl-alpha-D-muramate 1-phosphate uridylyltransferase
MTLVNKKPNKAFIFAAGLGTRMRPLTDNTPKPLIKVGGKALLDYQIEMVMEAGIKTIIINTFYLPEQVEGHVQKYLEKGVDIKIFRETERLETGGGLLNAMDIINYEPIFTLNSDVIFRYKTNPLKRLLKNWNPEKYDLFMMLSEKDNAVGYYEDGNFNVDEQGFFIMDSQKPYIYTGLQIINCEVLKKYSHKKIFSLSEVFKEASAHKRISGLINDGNWLHVGDLKGLKEAEDFLSDL